MSKSIPIVAQFAKINEQMERTNGYADSNLIAYRYITGILHIHGWWKIERVEEKDNQLHLSFLNRRKTADCPRLLNIILKCAWL